MIIVDQVEPRRDGYGRPKVDGESMTRTSTLAKALEDSYNLTRWGQRQVGIGVARTPHLIAGFASADPKNSRTLNELVDEAMDASGATASRTIGTAIHAATETWDAGGDLTHLPNDIAADVAAYGAALKAKNLTPVMGEVFVANPTLKVAGTFDRLVQSSTGGYGILDIKTSSNPETAKWAALGWAVQIATYAHSLPYCAQRGYMQWQDLGVEPPSTDFGVVAHIMQGTGQCRLYRIDLKKGYEYAALAAKVRDVRKDKSLVAAL